MRFQFILIFCILLPTIQVLAQQEFDVIDHAIIVTREKRRRSRRDHDLQIGSRTPPNFESRTIDLTETDESANSGGRHLQFDNDGFWDAYISNFDSMSSMTPSYLPSPAPSQYPSYLPTRSQPSDAPTALAPPPSLVPTNAPRPPTFVPTFAPTPASAAPVSAPTDVPVLVPTGAPIPVQTDPPTPIPIPTTPPTSMPTNASAAPTNPPVSVSPVPTPSDAPIGVPTLPPVAPTIPPVTAPPVPLPTNQPIAAPTLPPVAPTNPPVSPPPVPIPTNAPIAVPTLPPVAPTNPPVSAPPVPMPTNAPIAVPTLPPVAPTNSPASPPPVPIPTNAPIAVAPTSSPASPPPVPIPTNTPIADPTLPPVPPTNPPMSGPSFVRQIIESVALQGGAELNNPMSYQSRALARTEEQIGIEMMTEAKIIQYYALYCIYNATNQVPNLITEIEGIVNIPRWIVASGWESNDDDPCSGQWFGVSCVNDQVTDLDLFSNLLTGDFPPEVSLLAADGPRSTGAGALRRLDLFDNMLLGNNGDNSWWEFLGSNFGFLFFKDTGFSGSLSRLPTNIQEFDCSFTFTSGGLNNANFQGLNSLRFAALDGNAYNSSVPSAFSSLPSLNFLYIVDGFISGDLSYMIGMPSLREHWIDTNPGLGGLLPINLPTVSTLESFSISSCDFQGTIPASYGDWGFTMKQMWMYDNSLTGTIPSQLGQLNTMRLLQLEGNSFVGSMPAEICANTIFPRPLEVLGADCNDSGFSCACCTCCSVAECPV